MADNIKIKKLDSSIVKFNDKNNDGVVDKGEELVSINFSDTDGDKSFNTFTITTTVKDSVFTQKELKENLASYLADSDDDTSGEALVMDKDKNLPIFTDKKNYNFKALKTYVDKFQPASTPTPTPTPTPTSNFNTDMNGVTSQINSAVGIFNAEACLTSCFAMFGNMDGMFNGLDKMMVGMDLAINNALNRIKDALNIGFNRLTNASATTPTTPTTPTTATDDPAFISKTEDPTDPDDPPKDPKDPVGTKSVKLTERNNTKTKGSKVIEIDIDLRYEFEKEGGFNEDKLEINNLIKEYLSDKTSQYRKERILATIARLKMKLDANEPNRKLGKARQGELNVTTTKFPKGADGKYSNEGITETICDMTISELKEKINSTINKYNDETSESKKIQLACSIAQLKSLYYQLKAKGKDKTGNNGTNAEIKKLEDEIKKLEAERTKLNNDKNKPDADLNYITNRLEAIDSLIDANQKKIVALQKKGAVKSNQTNNNNRLTPNDKAFFTKFTPEEIAKQPAEIQRLQNSINSYIDDYNAAKPTELQRRGMDQMQISQLREAIIETQNKKKKEINNKKAELQRLKNNYEDAKTKPYVKLETIEEMIRNAEKELRKLGVPEAEIKAIKGVKPTK